MSSTNKPKVIVTGGAGYIGSHTCLELYKNGFEPIVVDNLITGHEWTVRWGPFYKIDVRSANELISLFKKTNPVAIIHFAAFAYVGESVEQPLKYYDNNVGGLISLLGATRAHGIKHFIFSSSCATYGVPSQWPIREDTLQNPVNPYGQTKLVGEKILKSVCESADFNAIALRYFNAAGADKDMLLGEVHNPETHLIPNVICTALKGDQSLSVFGNDYPTPDGTGVRDYIHVTDLARAHVQSLQLQLNGEIKKFEAFNLGTGRGYSVLEIIEAVKKYTKKDFSYEIKARRAGDPPILVASAEKAYHILRWRPEYSDLETVIQTATDWFIKGFNP